MDWAPAKDGRVRLNCDGSVRGNEGLASAGDADAAASFWKLDVGVLAVFRFLIVDPFLRQSCGGQSRGLLGEWGFVDLR